MKNKILKSVLALCVVSTMVVGTVSTSLASDAIAAPESTEVTEEVTVGDVIDAIEDAEKEASDVIVSLPFGDVKETEKDVVADEENAAGDIQDATDIIADAEGKVEEALDGTDVSGEVDTASESVENALTDISDLNATIDAAIEKYGDADAFEFESSEQAKEVLDEVDAAYTAASEAYTTAQNDLTAAQEAVAAAQEKVDAAQAISDEALAEAEAELANAQAFLAVAEANAKEAYDRVAIVSGLLSKASDLLESWKSDVDGTIEDLKDSLDENQQDLQDAIDDLETEEKDFIDAVTVFNTKYSNFVSCTNAFYNSVLTAIEKEEALYAMQEAYYEAVEAYEAAQEALDNFDEEDLETAKAALDVAGALLANANTVLEEATAAYLAQKAIVDAIDRDYIAALDDLKETLASETATEEEKEAAAKEAARLMVEKEIANGNTVQFVTTDDGYGISENGFFVVLDAEENVVNRYGYKVEDESVNVYEMTGVNTTNYVTYKGTQYAIEVIDGAEYITVDGEKVQLFIKDGKRYTVESYGDDAVGSRDDKTHPTKVEYVYGKFFGVELTSTHDTKVKDGQLYVLVLDGHKELPLTVNGTTVIATYSYKFFGQEKTKTYELNIKEFAQIDTITLEGTTYDLDKVPADFALDTTNKTYHRFVDEYLPGGDADTEFEYVDEKKTTSNTYSDAAKAEDALYEELLDAYNEALSNQTDAQNGFDAAQETANELQSELDELVENLEDAKAEKDAKDLGSLVNLPVSVADLFNTVKISNIDDLNAVMDAISTLTNSDTGIFSKTSAAIKLLHFVNVEGVDAKELAEAVLDKDSYKHEYVMAWLAALEAKGDVAKSAWDVVKATEETIVSGLVVISEGQQLGDAAVDVLLAQIKRDILEGSVSVLVIASDVLGAADSIVSSLEAKVSALEAETEEAYNAVLAAQEALYALKLTNPGQDAIDAAQAELDAANETLAALEEKLAEAETALLDAKDYRAEAEAEYEKLVESEDSDKDDTDDADDTDDKDDTDDADDIDDTDDVTTPGETVPGGTTPGETVPGGTTTPSVPESTPIVNIINAAETAPVVMPVPAVIAANPANAVANTPVATIDDEETPLAANDEEDDVEDEEETTEIEDEDTPLNATDTQVVPEVKKGFNWWWLLLLLIPVAGVTGYVIYKKKVQKVTTEE